MPESRVLGLHEQSGVSRERLAEVSRAALDAPLAHAAVLVVTEGVEEGPVLGAFQRGSGPRRGSGGPTVFVGPGTVHVLLALSRPDALVACDAPRLVNRYVRPLLRALTKVGATAHYFGRDWVSVSGRPAAWVGFSHHAGSGRAAFEAFVAVTTPFAREARASFQGKVAGSLEEIVGKPTNRQTVARAVVQAYADAYGSLRDAALPAAPSVARPLDDDTPWRATVEEVIGTLGAGPDRVGAFRVGGDLMASCDAIAALERAIAALPQRADEETVGRAVDDALSAPGVAVQGLKSLASVRDVVMLARR